MEMHIEPPSQFGQLSVLNELEDLELLTDLLEIRGEHLNLVLATESYIQRVPQGERWLSPVVRRRLQCSVETLKKRLNRWHLCSQQHDRWLVLRQGGRHLNRSGRGVSTSDAFAIVIPC